MTTFSFTGIVDGMTKDDFTELQMPDTPGVYFFLGPQKEILYIGKATSLRNRVRSYFDPALREKRSEWVERMVADALSVDWTVTDSVLEALILETNLIRTHKPRHNTISKDDKSYNHLIITNEEWPRLVVVRAKDLTERFGKADIQYAFGPFPHGSLFKEALKIIRKLFKYYDTKTPVGGERTKLARGQLDFNRQIGLYPDQNDKQRYHETIRHIRLFFQGKKATVIRELKKSMMRAAKKQAFEEAEQIKRKIFALEHIQDVALIKDDFRHYRDEKNARIEAYDIAHLQGDEMVGVMTVIEGAQPKKSDYRKFKIQTLSSANDTAALREVLERRLTHIEWPLPNLIVVDGSTAQKNAAENVLKKNGLSIPVVAVVKDKRHKPIRILAPQKLLEQFQNDILLGNAEAHRFSLAYHRSRRTVKGL